MKVDRVKYETRQFRDTLGFAIADTSKIKTKADCREALLAHRRWVEGACTDAIISIDACLRDLGIQYEDEIQPCSRCKGTGEIRGVDVPWGVMSGIDTCPKCHGEGTVRVEE